MRSTPDERTFGMRSWAYIGGPLLACGAIGVIERLSHGVLPIPAPATILLLLVVLSGVVGGFGSGLLTAVIAWLYVAYFFSTPGHPLHYTTDNLRQVLVWAVTMPTTVMVVALLKRRADLALPRRASRQSDAERRQLLEENSVLSQRYRSLFQGIPVGLYRSTPTGTLLDANPAFLRLLHCPDLQTLTTSNAAALYPDPHVRTRWMATLQSEGVITDFECQLRRYDGTLVWVRASARLVRDADGNPLYLEGATIDIAAHKATEEGLQKRTAELEAFSHVGRQLREARGVEEMYVLLVDHAMHLLGADHGTLALLSEDRRSLRRAHASGFLGEPGSVFPAAGSLSETVVETGQPFVAADLASGAPPTWQGPPRFRELGPILIVPVRSERDIIGTLCLARKRVAEVQHFTDADMHFLTTLVEMAGTAIRRARLHDGLEHAYFQTVLALAQTVDARDSYTRSHSDELARWVEALTRRMGRGEEEVRDSRWGALLHDIGKIAVPDEILRKEGPLTDEEWAVMSTHPVIGEEILRFVDGMQRVATIVRNHQERWDGTGYPDGLRGEEIPLPARILAVADAFGAIVNHRPYRQGRPSDEAIAEIRKGAGTQFDPAVVEAFCQVVADHEVEADVLPGQAPQPAAVITGPPAGARTGWDRGAASPLPRPRLDNPPGAP